MQLRWLLKNLPLRKDGTKIDEFFYDIVRGNSIIPMDLSKH